jgi:glycosyltransferase involved in cell wall biosynthesis
MLSLSKLRICYVAGSLGQGGAERQLFYALRGLQQSGAAPRVLCLEHGAFWEQPIKELGIPVTWVGQDSSRLKRLFRIRKELATHPADILQSQHFYTNGYVSVAARLSGCKAIGAIRNNGCFDMLDSGRLGGRLNLHLPELLAANSGSSIDYAVKMGVPKSRLYLLPNVVDTERFTTGSRQAPDTVTLVAVGRLVPEKRFDRFLSIVHQLRSQQQLPVRGIIVGSTRSHKHVRPELERQAASLGLLPDGIAFLGAISDMPAIYQQASVCVLTSDHEGTPNVLLEAMACGLPVVATNVGGVPEIVGDGQTGFLVPPGDIPAQTRAVSLLVRDANLRTEIGLRARDYVQRTHSVPRLPAHLRGLYELSLSKN